MKHQSSYNIPKIIVSLILIIIVLIFYTLYSRYQNTSWKFENAELHHSGTCFPGKCILIGTISKSKQGKDWFHFQRNGGKSIEFRKGKEYSPFSKVIYKDGQNLVTLILNE